MLDRRLLRILLVPSLAAVLGASALAGSADSASKQTEAPRSVIVGFRQNVSLVGQSDALADAGVKRMRRFPQIRSALVSVGARSTAGAVRSLESDPRVAYAEPNFVVRADDVIPNDPFLPRLWGLDNVGQTVNWTAGTPDADIDAKEAWSVSTGSPGSEPRPAARRESRSPIPTARPSSTPPPSAETAASSIRGCSRRAGRTRSSSIRRAPTSAR